MSLLDMFGKKSEEKEEPVQSNEPLYPELPVSLNKIMVVVDGSEASMDALNYAISVTRSIAGCQLCAVFVIDTANIDMLLQMHIFVGEEKDIFEAELNAKGRRLLELARSSGEKYGLDVETFLLKGRVTQIVLKAVQELNVDLLVIGGWHNVSTRKDTASSEYQLLLDQADCPVMVIKHRKG